MTHMLRLAFAAAAACLIACACAQPDVGPKSGANPWTPEDWEVAHCGKRSTRPAPPLIAHLRENFPDACCALSTPPCYHQLIAVALVCVHQTSVLQRRSPQHHCTMLCDAHFVIHLSSIIHLVLWLVRRDLHVHRFRIATHEAPPFTVQ